MKGPLSFFVCAMASVLFVCGDELQEAKASQAPEAVSGSAKSAQPYYRSFVSQNPFFETTNLVAKKAPEFNLTVVGILDHRKGAMSFGFEIEPNTVTLLTNPAIFGKILKISSASSIEFPIQVSTWQTSSPIIVYVAYVNPFYIRDNYNIRGVDEVFQELDDKLASLIRVVIAP